MPMKKGMKKSFTTARGYKSKDDKEVYEILGGKAVISLRPNSSNYQFRMWVKGENKYVRETLSTNSLETALKVGEDKCLELLGKLKSGRKIFGLNIVEASDLYLEEQHQRHKEGKITYGRYETIKTQMNKWIVPFVSTLKENWGLKFRVSDFQVHSFKYYGRYRREKTKGDVQEVTIRNEFTTINHFIKFLYEEGHILLSRIKPEEIRITGDKIRRRDTFTIEEYRVLTKSLSPYIKKSKDHYEEYNRKLLRDFILIKSNAFLRFGEIIKLKWKMIKVYTSPDDGQRMMLIKLPAEISKTRREREILTRGGNYLDRIKTYSEYTKKENFIFSMVDRPDAINRYSLYREWNKLLEFNKLDNVPDKSFTFYSLRHFGITMRLYAKVPLRVVSKMAGTSTSNIENHYEQMDIKRMESLARQTIKVDKDTGFITADEILSNIE